jgi:hypothetical protein
MGILAKSAKIPSGMYILLKYYYIKCSIAHSALIIPLAVFVILIIRL